MRELERTNALLRDKNAERQRIEAELRQSERNLQTIIDTIQPTSCVIRGDGVPIS